jgi:RNA polymerase sigma factor (sigma-70 family)
MKSLYSKYTKKTLAKTDERLVREVGRGDDRSLEQLITRHFNPLLKFSLKFVSTIDEAEDIVQDTFLKFWRHIDRFRSGNKFRPWIYTIARNTALDHLKRRRSMVFSQLDDIKNDIPFTETIADNEPIPSMIHENMQLANDLDNAFTNLPLDHRVVLVLHYHEDMTFQEISGAMKIPMNTVKSWHRRALFRLRPYFVMREYQPTRVRNTK